MDNKRLMGRRSGSARLCATLIALSAGYARSQTAGTVPIFAHPGTGTCNGAGGNDCMDSVISQDGSGNIGIGTGTPAAKLDIAGGNLNLANSTAASGNILKAGLPFLHNVGPASTFLGSSAGTFSVTGDSNTALGFQALSAIAGGFSNTAVGAYALAANSSGHTNTAVGAAALQSNTTGYENTATGSGALFGNSSGSYNTANGPTALLYNSTGSRNVAVGRDALMEHLSGDSNVAVGFSTLASSSNDLGNIAIGAVAGFDLSRGDSNIYLQSRGYAESNTIRIGCADGTPPCGQNRFFAAGVWGSPVNGAQVHVHSDGTEQQLGVLASSRRFKEEIQDMGEASGGLRQLRPVTFHYKPEVQSGPRQLQYGLIAEEVAAVNPNLVEYSPSGEPFTVRYQMLVPMLLNELQRQDRLLVDQEKDLQALETRCASLAQRLSEAFGAAEPGGFEED